MSISLDIRIYYMVMKVIYLPGKVVPDLIWNNFQMDELVINTIVRVLSAEEQAARLSAPPGVGKRPYLMTPDLPASWY